MMQHNILFILAVYQQPLLTNGMMESSRYDVRKARVRMIRASSVAEAMEGRGMSKKSGDKGFGFFAGDQNPVVFNLTHF